MMHKLKRFTTITLTLIALTLFIAYSAFMALITGPRKAAGYGIPL